MSPEDNGNKRSLSKSLVKKLPGFQNWTQKEFNMKGQSEAVETFEESNSIEPSHDRPGLGEPSFMQTQGPDKKIETFKVPRGFRDRLSPTKPKKASQSRRLSD